MAEQPTTKLAASGQRFLLRRMEHALVRSNIAMHDDPLRAQSLSLVAGCVLAVIGVAACVILAFIRPQGSVGSAPIVMVRDSGALYVRVDDVLHPVPNLASARIIAGSAANPVVVAEAAVAGATRGPSMGISGAPSAIGAPLAAPSWMVCDTDRTVVIVGLEDSAFHRLDDSRSVLVAPRGEGPATTYLLYDGRRAEVDLRNPAVVRALRLEHVAPVLVSRALLDSVPEVPAIAAPVIDGAGAAGPRSLDGMPVGAVVRVVRADATDYYAVLRDGVQRIGEVAADLIRFTYRGVDVVPTVAPSTIARTSALDGLAVGHLPQRAREPVGAGGAGVVCVRWGADRVDGRSRSAVLTGAPIAATAATLAQADGDGPNVDAVAVPAGRAVDARAAAIVGDDGSTGPRYLVSDMGVVYGIHDDDVASHLGLTGPPAPAPWPILAALPRGPELSAEAALVVRDGLTAPS
jgi:type VII secretion protein EccB